MKTKKDIIKLLKSGNFTIAGHDNGVFCLYEGKLKYDELPRDDKVATFEDWNNYRGYITEIIALLVKALGGVTDSK
jgi:hypothetical protein